VRFKRGDDFKEKGASHKTYGIDDGEWGNKIEVYGDSQLRNRILRYLNKTDKKKAEKEDLCKRTRQRKSHQGGLKTF
jgi:hypothetical protein